jgi:hypothetical protein
VALERIGGGGRDAHRVGGERRRLQGPRRGDGRARTRPQQRGDGGPAGGADRGGPRGHQGRDPGHEAVGIAGALAEAQVAGQERDAEGGGEAAVIGLLGDQVGVNQGRGGIGAAGPRQSGGPRQAARVEALAREERDLGRQGFGRQGVRQQGRGPAVGGAETAKRHRARPPGGPWMC